MRAPTYIILQTAAVGLMACATALAGEDPKEKPSAGLELVASLQKTEVTHSDPVVLKLVLINKSGAPIEYVDQFGPIDLHFLITAPDGKPAASTVYAKKEAARGPYSSKKTVLEPGEHRNWYVLLTRYCDMSIDGTYTIQVQRDFSIVGKADAVPVISNALEIAIRGDGNLRWEDPSKTQPTSNSSKRQSKGTIKGDLMVADSKRVEEASQE